MSKSVELAIFWLPLVAGVLLGGIAGSAWYGGDKIAALWIAFVGIICLLLTATFQVQAYVQSTLLQPHFEITVQQKSVLVWDPPTSNDLNIRGEHDQLPQGHWRVPIFPIKNTTPVNAQDVQIKWSAAKYDASALVAAAPIFQGHQVQLNGDQLTLWGGGVPFVQPFSFYGTVEKPFVTRSGEVFLPLNVWNTAALFFVATLPTQAGSRSEPYYFDLEILWNIPENSKPARYRVKAVATKSPGTALFSATIEFSIES
ncbi:hypothetical protein ACVWWO_009529 [Bradyrhizobium sp. F1.13.1]